LTTTVWKKKQKGKTRKQKKKKKKKKKTGLLRLSQREGTTKVMRERWLEKKGQEELKNLVISDQVTRGLPIGKNTRKDVDGKKNSVSSPNTINLGQTRGEEREAKRYQQRKKKRNKKKRGLQTCLNRKQKKKKKKSPKNRFLTHEKTGKSRNQEHAKKDKIHKKEANGPSKDSQKNWGNIQKLVLLFPPSQKRGGE